MVLSKLAQVLLALKDNHSGLFNKMYTKKKKVKSLTILCILTVYMVFAVVVFTVTMVSRHLAGASAKFSCD